MKVKETLLCRLKRSEHTIRYDLQLNNVLFFGFYIPCNCCSFFFCIRSNSILFIFSISNNSCCSCCNLSNCSLFSHSSRNTLACKFRTVIFVRNAYSNYTTILQKYDAIKIKYSRYNLTYFLIT